MKPILSIYLVLNLYLLAFGANLPIASYSELGVDPALESKVDGALERFIDEKKRAGCVTAIAYQGKVIYFRALGKQDIDANEPMTKDTIFRIYSMSKPVTSVAAMMLYDQGKLKLDAPVSLYIPEFNDLQVVVNPRSDTVSTVPSKKPMTVKDLLCHTSGLTYGYFSQTNVDKLYLEQLSELPKGAVLYDMIKKLGTLPLLYEPGTRWNYSYSTDVVGYLVEKLSGQPLDQFLKEHLFEPLKMHDTDFYVPKEKLKLFSANYSPNQQGKLTSIDPVETSEFTRINTFFSGGGGLVSTTSDYMRFCLMLLNQGELEGHRILKPKTVRLMTRNHLPQSLMPIAFGKMKRHGIGFGLGFSVRVRRTNRKIPSRVGEYGWEGAASTHFWISPKDKIAVVVMSQYMPHNDELERSIKPIVYDTILKH